VHEGVYRELGVVCVDAVRKAKDLRPELLGCPHRVGQVEGVVHHRLVRRSFAPTHVSKVPGGFEPVSRPLRWVLSD
jgi:hypothetical protein